MNLLLLEKHDVLPDGEARVAGRRARHLEKVLRVVVGQEIRAACVGCMISTAKVLAIDKDSIRLSLASRESLPKVRPRLAVILALPRPKALRRIVRDVASFGATHLELVNAWKVSKSYFSSPVLEPEALRREALIGAEQGMKSRLPEIRVHRLLMSYLEGLKQVKIGHRLLADPSSGKTLMESLPTPREDQVTLAVGPEGGWIGREIDSFHELGFRSFQLTDSILRSEVAVSACLAQWELVRRRPS